MAVADSVEDDDREAVKLGVTGLRDDDVHHGNICPIFEPSGYLLAEAFSPWTHGRCKHLHPIETARLSMLSSIGSTRIRTRPLCAHVLLQSQNTRNRAIEQSIEQRNWPSEISGQQVAARAV